MKQRFQIIYKRGVEIGHSFSYNEKEYTLDQVLPGGMIMCHYIDNDGKCQMIEMDPLDIWSY